MEQIVNIYEKCFVQMTLNSVLHVKSISHFHQFYQFFSSFIDKDDKSRRLAHLFSNPRTMAFLKHYSGQIMSYPRF